jgi:hypothetical protein
MRILKIAIAVWIFVALQVIAVPAFAHGFGGGGGFHGGGGGFHGGGVILAAVAVMAGVVADTGAVGTVEGMGVVGTGAAGMAVVPTGGVTHTRMRTDLTVGNSDKQKNPNRG